MIRLKMDDGLRVVADPMPHSRVVAMGVYVAGGSRLDPIGRSGLSHFLEHAVFRGSRFRDGRSLSRDIDGRGAQANGYTDKEMTWFEAEALAEDAAFALDVLGEIALQPRLDARQVERERQVVLAEADEAADDGEERVLDLVESGLWPWAASSRPVVGVPAEVAAIPAEALAAHHAATYRPDRMVLSLAGALPEDLAGFVAHRLGGEAWRRPGPVGALPPADGTGPIVRVQRSVRELGQVHLAVGQRGPGRQSPHAAAALLLAELWGGGPSSRLFERLREEEGLAYTVYAHATQFSDRGLVGAYLSCAEADLGEAVTALWREIRRLGEGVDAEEVERARGALRGSLVFAQETAAGRMGRLAEEELLAGGAVETEERLRRIEAVPVEAVSALARALGSAAEQWSWAAVGPVEPDWDPGYR